MLKLKSNLNLVATSLDIKIGLAAAAIMDPAIKGDESGLKGLKHCIASFDQQLNTTLGVDQWLSL